MIILLMQALTPITCIKIHFHKNLITITTCQFNVRTHLSFSILTTLVSNRETPILIHQILVSILKARPTWAVRVHQ